MKRISTLTILFLFLNILLWATRVQAGEVVVYTSVDQIYSEPILQEFQNKTGIRVRAIYDVEAAKTTGLVNRLIAERRRPKCDVFWNSEIARTIVLKRKGILAPYHSPSAKDIPSKFKDKEGYWTGFAARARVLVYNTKLLRDGEVPKSIFELTEPRWKAKVALAYPLFGTTASHVAALFLVLGKEKAQQYLEALKANGVIVVNGNSVARDLVAQGTLPVAFTDTDDVSVAIREGKPVKMIFPDQTGIGTLLIPNTVALIKGAPHKKEGKALIDYLLSRETESRLAFCPAAQMPLRKAVRKPANLPDYTSIKIMTTDFCGIAEKMEEMALFCRRLFSK